jgi:hypothetical protein
METKYHAHREPPVNGTIVSLFSEAGLNVKGPNWTLISIPSLITHGIPNKLLNSFKQHFYIVGY